MKIAKIGLFLGALSLGFAGLVWADEAGSHASLHQLSKRPYVEHVKDKADRAWEGASLNSPSQPHMQGVQNRKQLFREQLNLQFTSKRPYVSPMADE